MNNSHRQLPGQLPLIPDVAEQRPPDIVAAQAEYGLPAGRVPSFIELMAAPELAVLHVLDAALDTAIQAMHAAYPEIDSDITRERWPDWESVRAAEEILQLSEDLHGAISGYWGSPTPQKAIAHMTKTIDGAENEEANPDAPF